MSTLSELDKTCSGCGRLWSSATAQIIGHSNSDLCPPCDVEISQSAPSAAAEGEEVASCASLPPQNAALREALDLFDDADRALTFWLSKRNDAGKTILELLGVQARYTTLSFSTTTMPWKWYGKRGAHLTPSARRELRRLQEITL